MTTQSPRRIMEKVEIRYDRKKLVIVILFCFFWVIVTSSIIFSTEPYSTYTAVKVITVLINGFVVYVACIQIKLLIENAPVLTLSESGIIFNNNGKISTFLWPEITDLVIEKVRAGNRGQTDVLMISSNTTIQKIPLASLGMSVTDIKTLISRYWHKPLSR